MIRIEHHHHQNEKSQQKSGKSKSKNNNNNGTSSGSNTKNKATKENVSNNNNNNKKSHKKVVEESDTNMLKTKFGYIIHHNNPKPERTPYSELKRRFHAYEAVVAKALKQQKVFRIISAYDVPTIRRELYKRGWVETVMHPWQNEYQKMTDAELCEKAGPGNDFEHVLLSRITGEKAATYVWLTANQLYTIHKRTPLLSKINIRDINFGAKDGLCKYVELLKHDKEKKAKYRINHPRVYNVTNDEGLKHFWEDFHLTAAVSMILYLDTRDNIYEYFSMHNGTIDRKNLDFAFKVILKRLAEFEGSLYPETRPENMHLEEQCLEELLKAHKSVVLNGGSFFVDNDDVETCALKDDYVCQISILAEEIRRRWKINRHDGVRNIWLLKPCNSSQGQGIILSNDRQKIEQHLCSKVKFVIQKYIEEPLLCYNTKFDIRSYFMILVDQTHVRMFCHPVCSVKLASCEFSLDDLNESIHITNAYVQQKYRYQTSNPNLPAHHMWSLGTLILYIESIRGDGHMWNEKVYPTMKRTLESLFWISVENIDLTPGRFELFGCDWIITNDYKPYLLEVQRPPGMGIFSPVSRIVCPSILRDVVKVSVDYFIDKTASTGDFELVCEVPFSEVEKMRKNKEKQ
ncbi:tubulin glycylase 3B-like [Culicoides brevitarsis]|uniref:tubulin glycylase 3B-like n=1 Tax=Culicoides brevitarsis TaxID=469753 RepID=UPI00307BFA27